MFELVAGFVALLLRFALVNHRSAERSRAGRQMIGMALFVAAAEILFKL
jgi:hypothetical protein